MSTIDHVIIEASGDEAAAAAERFYADTLGLGDLVQARASDAETSGFRGWTLSLVAAQPADVDALMRAAVEAGATTLQEPKKSLWGYGAAFTAPDGTTCTLACSTKKNSGPAGRSVESLVVQLGVDDVAASKTFYAGQGVEVAKSYGRKYVELDTGGVTVALIKRAALARTSGVPAEGTGSHRLALATGADAGAFTDPDGFAWENSGST